MKGELVAGRYEVEELVGAGGMSSVYRAHDRLLERKVALKILHQRYLDDDEYVERFRREARAVARLAHPNIVTVIDRGEEGGSQFIVFEYVEGENLKHAIEREGPLPVARTVSLGLAIARALAFAHESGLIHRDVKPQNVLLNGDGRAKVTDFGIARSLDVEQGMTQAGTVLGTSDYIAPEQASGQPVDDRSDVYSLGVVFFELLTGEVPFGGDNFVAVAMQHISEPPPSLLERRPDAPPALAGLVDRMLMKDYADRPAMAEVVAELEALGSGAPSADATAVLRSAPVRRRKRPARRRSRLPLVLAGLGAVLLGLAVGTVFFGDTPGDTAAAPGDTASVQAVRSHDPLGDGSEHEARVPSATDGDPSTYWSTESYRHPGGELGKEGVGIVLRLEGSPGALVVETETPGFVAEIRAGDRVVSPSQTVAAGAEFPLEEGTEGEVILWITNRGPHGSVRVNEVTGR